MTEGGAIPRPWESSYPEKLRGYRLDPATRHAHAADMLSRAAERHGASPAFTVVQPDGSIERLSFEDADRLSNAFAGFLENSLGLSVGDVLAVRIPNGLAFPVIVFGAWKAGLIVTPVNPFYTAVETRHQLRDSGAKVLVAVSAMLDELGEDFPGVHCLTADGPGLFQFHGNSDDDRSTGHNWSTLESALGTVEVPSGRRHDVALYQYTGGTTGRSKGAVITSANLLATAAIVRDFFGAFGSPIERGTALTALPLYHIFAFLFGMLIYVEAGTSNVIVPMPRPISNLRPAFERFEIDWMAGVDTLYAGLLAEPWFQENPPRLRFAIAGGAALRPNVAAAWEDLVGPLVEGYGLTESTGIASCNPPTAARRAGTVGLPVPGCDVRIVDDRGHDVAPGDSGELMIRGPHVAAGYLGHPLASADGFDGEWLRTGDVAVFEAGMLVIRDRSKDMILVSGFNVYPNEVEAVLNGLEGVLEAAVIGKSDARTGESVRAYVVLNERAPSVAELDRHCRLSLAPYKVPREFIVRKELPKSSVGKILRAELRRATAADDI